ncbi:SH3 domain-containing C40 family peptidase [Sulfurimonas marina]|uniref:Glycoside hydrolase n=1 Tax=Sulfurimonas marina TaxID=2590551 RepID=A0A7M1AXE1_9BACT|nr:SH3 domain-containing C40 family peptidase [Sulfurimonas marina]QOP41248.1 glycoside hydrolase [Sulfurimonas marina]
MNYIYSVVAVMLLSGCAQKVEVTQEKKIDTAQQKEIVQELVEIPQKPSFYTSGVQEKKLGDIELFIGKYFRAWNIDKISITQEQAKWAYVYDNNKSYGYTLQPITKSFFQTIDENSNYEAFSTLNRYAVTLKLLNVRALPTDKPVFLDPSKAGEGYPFDYLQNTSIAPNKPIFVSHYSKDKKWVFIESSFGFGWVKAKDIVFIDQKYTLLWQKAQQIFLLKDNETIYDQNGNYLFDSRVGMMLPLIDEDEKSYTVLSVAKSKENEPLFLHSKISKEIAHKGILDFNSDNVAVIMNELQKGKYGWGGIYGQRDCSSTLRDLYTPFGLWLPRNSSVQSSIGDVKKLDLLSNEEKELFIKEKGIPFETLVYKKGHIALYVGTYNDQAIIFQNVWGVKTKKDENEGRFLIAKPVFSTLEVGKNLKEFDPDASMLSKLQSINHLLE